MAHAERVAASVDAKDKRDVRLTLTIDEAETLLAIADRIGGDPFRSRRRYMDSIKKSLLATNVESPSVNLEPESRVIYFRDGF